MNLILHLDDNPDWLENFRREIGGRLGAKYQILSRLSTNEAMRVLDASDSQTKKLMEQGGSLRAVVVDLMLGGGTIKALKFWRCWLEAVLEVVLEVVQQQRPEVLDELTVADIANMLTTPELEELEEQCRDQLRDVPGDSADFGSLGVSREAFQRGLPIVVLTNIGATVDRILPNISPEIERKLILAGSRASGYVVKNPDSWIGEIMNHFRGWGIP